MLSKRPQRRTQGKFNNGLVEGFPSDIDILHQRRSGSVYGENWRSDWWSGGVVEYRWSGGAHFQHFQLACLDVQQRNIYYEQSLISQVCLQEQIQKFRHCVAITEPVDSYGLFYPHICSSATSISTHPDYPKQ